MVELVQKEIDNAKNGGKAEINLKLNNLTDPDMIGLLYDAADAGVQVQLNVRGMYSLLPQTLEHQKNIEGIGIIDRLLEHTRIFVFHNGGDEKVFLSSGDWMTRNLDRRVEVTFPVYDKDLQRELKSFLDIQWRDNTKARVLDTALTNRYRPRRGTLVRAQSAFYEYIRIRSESEPEADAQALA
jgi:polyphosphate kinase